jgi:DNA-binding MarR family transcriptional regulator
VSVCATCGRPFPPEQRGLDRLIMEALAEGSATATELAKRLGRRRTAVERALVELEARGLVERTREARGRTYARPWILKASGQALDKRQAAGAAEDDLLPVLPFFVALAAAGAADHHRAQVSFAAAAALFLLALWFETVAQSAPAARGNA